MRHSNSVSDVGMIAAAIDAEMRSLPQRNTSAMRRVRRRYSQVLRDASPDFIYRLAQVLCKTEAYRWLAYELLLGHRKAFESLTAGQLEELGQGNHSWWTVDAFARTLAGPLWLRGRVPDSLIMEWAGSEDPWWRRTALVSTVALNVRSYGGNGDIPRTLRICDKLASDHEDMVAKALSWALRELVIHDPKAVREFMTKYDAVLAARVKREVRNKLETGLKNPAKKGR